jgi:hypothetical protein
MGTWSARHHRSSHGTREWLLVGYVRISHESFVTNPSSGVFAELGQEVAETGPETKLPQAIRFEPCSVSPLVADAGPRDPTLGVGSRV